MQIVIDVSAYFDWEPADDGFVPTDADLLALRFKPAQNGKWLKKALKEQASQTAINLPESEIADCMAHFERIGRPKTRARTVAWYLEEKVMQHHAHPDHWGQITVHDEPELEKFLNKFFELDEEAVVVPPVLVQKQEL